VSSNTGPLNNFSFFESLFRRVRNSEFARHVSTLATGTLLAQIIGLLAGPIVTRLYAPENYAVLALFTAIISTIAPAASGCYGMAVVIAKDEEDGNGLLVLALWLAGVVSLLILLVFTLGHRHLKQLLGADSLGIWWFFIPVVLFLTAAVSAFRYYANRHKHYALISKVLVAQALFGATISISLGVGGFQTDGLLISSLLGAVFGTVLLLYFYHKEFSLLEWRPSSKMWDLSKKYKQFPIYGASTSFLDGITSALPVLMLTKFFPPAIVGQFALGLRVFSAPLSFISSSVSQVHLRKVAELTHFDASSLLGYTLKLSLLLLMIAGIPSLLLYFFIPSLFAFVFGTAWRHAGEILSILLPSLVIKFVASSVSGVFSATGHLKLVAIWKVVALLVTFIGLFWATNNGDASLFFYTLLIIDLLLYVILFVCIMYAVTRVRQANHGVL